MQSSPGAATKLTTRNRHFGSLALGKISGASVQMSGLVAQAQIELSVSPEARLPLVLTCGLQDCWACSGAAIARKGCNLIAKSRSPPTWIREGAGSRCLRVSKMPLAPGNPRRCNLAIMKKHSGGSQVFTPQGNLLLFVQCHGNFGSWALC